jgi:phage protein U
MLMVLGLFVFERRTLPYQSMQYSKDYRWASNDRIGKPPAYQYLGKGKPRARCRACSIQKLPADVCH